MKVSDFISQTAEKIRLQQLECADPLFHAKQIIEFVLGWDSHQLHSRSLENLSPDQVVRLETFLEKRLSGEPFQYLTGSAGFWKHQFEVGPGVLIPRPETELLVEQCLLQKEVSLKVAELGAGSGNIGISVISERPQWEWFAFEKSQKSFSFAKKNAERLLGANSRYSLTLGDFFERALENPPFDLLVSNPPYIAREDLSSLSVEVQSEPRLALEGGKSGIEVVERLLQTGKKLLSPGGVFLSEIGSDQGTVATQTAVQLGWSQVSIIKDLSGKDRVLRAVLEK